MLTPFAPFFVLFCHFIETPDTNDMELLRRFTESLDSLKDASKTAEKLYRLCRAMWDVACAYHEDTYFQGIPPGQSDMERSFGNEFDMYLDQLDFSIDPSVNNAQISEIGDWFFGGPSSFG